MSNEQLVCPVKKPEAVPISKCPVDHTKRNNYPTGSTTNTSSNTNTNEPPDTVDHFMQRNSAHYAAKVIENPNATDIHDIIPGESIPATGRGNSESGDKWLNPSANQLYHSLKRKSKAIEYSDALSVAHVHSIVTNQTWDEIIKYESFHFNKCKQPKLARFEGKDGFYSPKARFYNTVFQTPLPYDRHDWTVDRCGTEIEYVIDYYAIPIPIENTSNNNNKLDNKNDEYLNDADKDSNEISYVGKYEESSTDSNPIDNDNVEYIYTIDARPKLNSFGNAFDRIRMSLSNWWKGE